jgi:hypothetical protein
MPWMPLWYKPCIYWFDCIFLFDNHPLLHPFILIFIPGYFISFHIAETLLFHLYSNKNFYTLLIIFLTRVGIDDPFYIAESFDDPRAPRPQHWNKHKHFHGSYSLSSAQSLSMLGCRWCKRHLLAACLIVTRVVSGVRVYLVSAGCGRCLLYVLRLMFELMHTTHVLRYAVFGFVGEPACRDGRSCWECHMMSSMPSDPTEWTSVGSRFGKPYVVSPRKRYVMFLGGWPKVDFFQMREFYGTRVSIWLRIDIIGALWCSVSPTTLNKNLLNFAAKGLFVVHWMIKVLVEIRVIQGVLKMCWWVREPALKQEIAFVKLVPRILTGTFFETPCIGVSGSVIHSDWFIVGPVLPFLWKRLSRLVDVTSYFILQDKVRSMLWIDVIHRRLSEIKNICETFDGSYVIQGISKNTVRLLGTRFKARNCICEPCPQEPYRDVFKYPV